MEPLQTWWATELYPSKAEDTFGVAGDFEVVLAADAQATIAALRGQVREYRDQIELLQGMLVSYRREADGLRVNGQFKGPITPGSYQQGRVAGLREAEDDMRSRLELDRGSTDDDVWAHIEWLAQQAQEGGVGDGAE